jgi:predicted enzyme related to lactoylglutathione lyase
VKHRARATGADDVDTESIAWLKHDYDAGLRSRSGAGCKGKMSENEKTRLGTDLETVIIFTKQMDELARFYREGLDLGPWEHSPGHLGQRLGGVYFGFDQVEGAAGGRRSGATLWFTVDDIEGAFGRLLGLGAEVWYPPTEKPWGALLAAVHDLDGNVLGLSQRQPQQASAQDVVAD